MLVQDDESVNERQLEKTAVVRPYVLIFIRVKFSLTNVAAIRFLSQERAALQHRVSSAPNVAINFPKALPADGTYREPEWHRSRCGAAGDAAVTVVHTASCIWQL